MKMKKSVYCGMIIQILAIIFALICVFTGNIVPGFVTVLMLVGLFIILYGSFSMVKENKSTKITKLQFILPLIVLILLTVVLNFTTVLG